MLQITWIPTHTTLIRSKLNYPPNSLFIKLNELPAKNKILPPSIFSPFLFSVSLSLSLFCAVCAMISFCVSVMRFSFIIAGENFPICFVFLHFQFRAGNVVLYSEMVLENHCDHCEQLDCGCANSSDQTICEYLHLKRCIAIDRSQCAYVADSVRKIELFWMHFFSLQWSM